MRVYIANFGRENYEWPNCLARSTVATMNAEAVHGYWLNGDREAYVNWCLANGKTAAGITPTRPVASRWFNLMTIIAETVEDLWIHREKDQVWWTISKSDRPTITLEVDPKPLHNVPRVYVCHKPCQPWSNQTKKGNRIEWSALHPMARTFLFTEGTLQQLSEENARYAKAVIDGDDLAQWHSRPDWRAKVESARKSLGTVFNARQRSVWEMVHAVKQTVVAANGQQVLRTVKNKEDELRRYIEALLDAQEGLCAITGIPLQYIGEADDRELLCSLDRIDSDGHYEAGNLQVVCRFVNRWKNDGDNSEFRRLIGVVRSQSDR